MGPEWAPLCPAWALLRVWVPPGPSMDVHWPSRVALEPPMYALSYSHYKKKYQNQTDVLNPCPFGPVWTPLALNGHSMGAIQPSMVAPEPPMRAPDDFYYKKRLKKKPPGRLKPLQRQALLEKKCLNPCPLAIKWAPSVPE